jgi:hypothetical protein
MDRDSYLAGVAELYTGEIIGEGLASRWLELTDDPQRQYKLMLLLQFESEAKVRLRPFLARLGLSIAESAEARSAGVGAADTFAQLPWCEGMQQLADLSRPYLERYQALLAAAPPADQPWVSFMAVHEAAVVRFAELEAGQGDGAVHALLPLLSFAPPPPG